MSATRVLYMMVLCATLAVLRPAAAIEMSLLGGIASPFDSTADEHDVGFSAGASVRGALTRDISAGGEFGWNYWEIVYPEYLRRSFRGSVTMLEVLFVMNFNRTLSREAAVFLEPGGGLCYRITDVDIRVGDVWRGDDDSDETCPLVSLCGGLRLSWFVIRPGIKVAFTDDISTKWFTLSFGVDL